jgi:hypothetical protein
MATEGRTTAGERVEAAEEIDEHFRGLRVGAGAQVSKSFPATSSGDVIAGGSNDNRLGLEL